MKPITYIFTEQQIRDLDTTGFIRIFGTDNLAPTELRGLLGAVRIRVERVPGTEQVFTEGPHRLFFRKLCSEWPAAYFLRLGRVTSPERTEELLDAGMFVSLALCHTSVVYAQWDGPSISTMNFNAEQFSSWMEESAKAPLKSPNGSEFLPRPSVAAGG